MSMIKKLALVQLVLLITQYILGMLANFYQEVPKDNPGYVFSHNGYIFWHSNNAFLLLAVAIWLLVLAVRSKTVVQPAIGGLVNILIAAVFGHIFVATGADIWSLLMSLAFIGAFASYGRIVYFLRAKQT